MFKRDDYNPSKHDAVFSKWQGFAGSMFLRKPVSELRRTVADYSLISRDLAPKVPTGANGGSKDVRKGIDFVGRYKVQESIPGLGVAVINHDPDHIRTRLRSYGRSIPHQHLLNKLGHNEFTSQREPAVSQTITQKKIGSRSNDKKGDIAEEKEISFVADEEKSDVLASIRRLSRSRPQPVSGIDDEIVDGSDSASVCGVFLEDGTTCTTTPIKGRKRCTEHKGKRISCVPSVKTLPCEVPTGRECEETEDICGVILPDMVRCRTKPVSGRKRCEDHKGMRVNAFFFLLNPTQRDQALRQDRSKPETRTGSMKQKESSEGLLCEATTKNGSPCTRTASNGSRRCWQHKDETVDHISSENVQSPTVSQIICGVKLYNGSVCEKPPVKGRKRCEEHKGMRVTS